MTKASFGFSLAAIFAEDVAASTRMASDMQKKVESLLSSDKEKELFNAIPASNR